MSDGPRQDAPGGQRILYLHNDTRAHKLRPLLQGLDVRYVRTWRSLRAAGRECDESFILIDSFGKTGALGVLASFLLRFPLILRLRGEVFRDNRERLTGQTGMARWVQYGANQLLAHVALRRASLIVFNSEYLARVMAPFARQKASAIVYNPFTEMPGPRSALPPDMPGGGLHLLTVTNMNLWAKVGPTLRAIESWLPAEVWAELDLHWIVCGDGYYARAFRERPVPEEVRARLRTPGFVQDIRPYYDWCHVLVHLTEIDAFPNAPLEAMMCGKPVVTNPESCGTREQVRDGCNGFIVEDAQSFVRALRAYAHDPALRRKHGQAGRKLVVSSFSVESQRARMRDALTRRLGARSPSG